MIKTEYLGASLAKIELVEEDIWDAVYWGGAEDFVGTGHTPEAALADAQRQIQELQGL